MAGLVTEDAKKGLANFPLTANIATKLEAFTANVAVTDGVQADINIYATDEKSANDLQQTSRSRQGLHPAGQRHLQGAC